MKTTYAKLLLALLFIAVQFSSTAQYTMITDFASGAAISGSNPRYDQNFINVDGVLYGMTVSGGSNNLGTVFRMNSDGSDYSIILNFEGLTNGQSPYGSLISDGTYLYGMTVSGGANNKGAAFKIQISDNIYTKILDFDGITNGAFPYSSLMSDGTYLYGMTGLGGANNMGTIFKIKISDNSYTKILDFAGTTNGQNPWASLISDGTYLYGMTLSGGANNMGTAFKIKISDNSYTKILDFAGTTNGLNPYGSFISDGTNLYGMTYGGGLNQKGTLFKIKISDNSYSKILDFAGTINGQNPYGSLINDGTYLYGMTSSGGANNLGTAFKIKISDNTYSKILDFAGASNGSIPYGSLILDGTFLYGMTNVGGAYGGGTSFKIKISDNSFTNLFDFRSRTNGTNPNGALITDGTFLYGMTSQGGVNNLGTVYKIKISDNSYTKILDFEGVANGSIPYGSLVFDGIYLYGMTAQGGTSNFGTVFKIKISDNSYTKILDFNSTANGSSPYGSLITDGTYLYGTTFGGGASNRGTVFKIKISDNSYTKFFDFAGASNGSNPFGSIIYDGTFLYGMTCYGGVNNMGTAFKIKISDNAYTKILDFAGITDGKEPMGALISDGTYLYGMTPSGGANDMGTLFKIQLSDNSYSKILDFAGTTNGKMPLGSLTTDGTYLYGMTQQGGINNRGTAFKINISDNSYTKLLDFAGAVNGHSPSYSHFLLHGNYLYGMTSSGGSVNAGTVFKYQIYAPEIDIKQNTTNILSGGSYDFGNVTFGANSGTLEYAIENSGVIPLTVSSISSTGANASLFAVAGITLPATIAVGGSATFSVTYTPDAASLHTATINIVNDDPDENSYNFTVSGTGLKADQAITNFISIPVKTYGDVPFTLSATGGASGNPIVFTSSDETVATCTGTNGQDITILKAGSCKIFANQTGNSNFNDAPQVEQTLSISKKQIDVYAEAKSKIYCDPDPTLTYTYAPALVTGDKFSGSLTRIVGECGNCAAQIQQGTLTLGDNYTIIYHPEDLMIGYRPVTVTVLENQSKTYGTSDPIFQYEITSGSLASGHVFSGALTRVSGENQGTYAIEKGSLAINNNYTLTFVGKNFAITKRPITVTANAGQKKTFGESDPTEYTYTSSETLLGGNSFTGRLSRETGENAGNYAINQGTLSAGNNYTISFTGNDFVINPKNLTVSVVNVNKQYKEANPVFSYNLSTSLVGTDAISGVTYTCQADQSSSAGTYDIMPSAAVFSSGSESNYSITYSKGTLTINKVDQVISFASLPLKIVGDADFDAGATANSGLTVTYTSSNSSVATIVNGQIHIVGAGTTDITASQLGNENYNIAPDVTESLTVSLPTEINESFGNSIQVYPNPNNGVFTIRYDRSLTEESKISMVDMNGKTVSIKITVIDKEIIIDSKSSKGVYLVIIENGQSKTINKVVVQ